MSFSVDETLFPGYVKLLTRFREPHFSLELSPFMKNYHGSNHILLIVVVGALGTIPKKAWKEDWKSWKSEEETGLFKRQHC